MPNGRDTALTLPVLLALSVLTLLLVFPAEARDRHQVSTSSTEAPGCAGVEVRIDGRTALRAEETLVVPGRETLVLSAPGSGGLRVEGWDRPDFEVTACKAAFDAAALSGISVRARGGTVDTSGNADGTAVFFLVKAPRGSSLDLAAHNGPVSLRDLSANVTVDVTNGPLSMKGVRGTVKAAATNGPLSIAGASGDVRAKAVNGPLSVDLAGSRWDGKGLSAETLNGPLSLSIDPAFGSAVRVSGSGHGPVRCKAAACATARRSGGVDDEEGPVVEIGGGEPVVRLTTVNGPISIRDPRPRNAGD